MFQLVYRVAVIGLVSVAGLAGCSDRSSAIDEPAAPTGEKAHADAMHDEHLDDAPVANPMSVPAPDTADVDARMLEYGRIGDQALLGYLAMPSDFDSTLPSVIVIHEWWGLNDNIRAMTEKLAAEGYVALAVDLYGGRTADDADGARTLMREATTDMGRLRTNLRTAFNFLSRTAGAERVGTLGWCFGGGMSLQTALMLPGQVDATVIYYGQLETDADKLEPLRMPVLGIFGADDSSIPVSTVREFEATLESLGKDVEIHVYEGADHAFANPSGTRYNATAAEDAWATTIAFLDRHLKN